MFTSSNIIAQRFESSWKVSDCNSNLYYQVRKNTYDWSIRFWNKSSASMKFEFGATDASNNQWQTAGKKKETVWVLLGSNSVKKENGLKVTISDVRFKVFNSYKWKSVPCGSNYNPDAARKEAELKKKREEQVRKEKEEIEQRKKEEEAEKKKEEEEKRINEENAKKMELEEERRKEEEIQKRNKEKEEDERKEEQKRIESQRLQRIEEEARIFEQELEETKMNLIENAESKRELAYAELNDSYLRRERVTETRITREIDKLYETKEELIDLPDVAESSFDSYNEVDKAFQNYDFESVDSDIVQNDDTSYEYIDNSSENFINKDLDNHEIETNDWLDDIPIISITDEIKNNLKDGFDYVVQKGKGYLGDGINESFGDEIKNTVYNYSKSILGRPSVSIIKRTREVYTLLDDISSNGANRLFKYINEGVDDMFNGNNIGVDEASDNLWRLNDEKREKIQESSSRIIFY